jgi:hypothetical protein
VPEAPNPTPARLWGDQWLRVSEKVLKGLNHQLSNRVASIEALTMMLEPGGSASDETVHRALADEVERLGRVMRLYRLLPPEPTAAPEPVRPQDIIPQVLELHAHHADLKRIAYEVAEDPSVEPVCVRPSALLRSLLVLFESVAGHATRAGSSGPVFLRCAGEGEWVTIVMEGPSPTAEPLGTGEGTLVAAVRGTLDHAAVRLAAERSGAIGRPWIRYALTLPTLAKFRAMEAEQALGTRH